jgi:hypothetical protein
MSWCERFDDRPRAERGSFREYRGSSAWRRGAVWAALGLMASERSVEGNRNQLDRNHVFRNQTDIDVVGDANVITRNRVEETIGGGRDSGPGIAFNGGHGNVIAFNVVERTFDVGISVAGHEPETPPAVGNIVRMNLVRDAGGDGIFVDVTATDTLVDRNASDHNGDDGIDVDSAATTLAKNRATYNVDLGIEAVHGVTDGGGNRAFGNGNPLQCTNVFCK